MRMKGLLFTAAMASLASCDSSFVEPPQQPPAFGVAAGIPSHATVSFGRDDVGSAFPPPSGHDASFHAKDKIRPHVVQIRAGGTVTFEMGTFHQVTIYDHGTEPEDIDVSTTIDLEAPPGTVIIPDFLIDDPTNRIEVGPFSFEPMSWTSSEGTFDEPGTYLVICRVVPHFVDANMYAWVVVR